MSSGLTKDAWKQVSQELISALVKAGISKHAAKCLVYLIAKENATSMEIESAMEMRQPEVSIGLQELRVRNWVTKTDKKREGKGRPIHTYQLGASLDEVIQQIENAQKEKIQEITNNIEKIKSLAKNLKA